MSGSTPRTCPGSGRPAPTPERAWAAGAAPATGGWLHLDVDATITIDHSDNKENAAPTWKKTFGHHPLLAFLDRPEIAGGEALAGLLRPGNAGSNTAADHVTVLRSGAGIAAGRLPARPGTIRAPERCWCAAIPPGPPTLSPTPAARPGWGSPSATPSIARVRDAVETLNLGDGWYPAIDTDGGIRDGAWVAEATDLVDLSSWPAGTRVILRKERPHPGAQLRFTDSDGMRVTAFITDTAPGVVPGQLAGLELRHRQHARVEDRIRKPRPPGCATCRATASDANAAWLEIILAATDLVTWAKLIGFTDHPDLARCEIDTFRYRVLHVAARITRGARQTRLRIDATWRWAHRSPPPGTTSAPLSPNRETLTRPDERPHRPWKARPPSDTGELSYPSATISIRSRPAPTPSDPTRPREKSRLVKG